jgi:serine/threonine protein phosphatase PrpC
MQGWRTTMEDAHIAVLDFQPNVHLFGVLDGHGGEEVAQYSCRLMLEYILKQEAYQKKNYALAFEKAFSELDRSMLT